MSIAFANINAFTDDDCIANSEPFTMPKSFTLAITYGDAFTDNYRAGE